MRKQTDTQKKKKLWKLFSEYIRRKDAVNDMNRCFTCGRQYYWKILQGGHYVRKSSGLSLYFDEQNVHPQCYACNIWRDGNTDEYALKLQEKYGKKILQELNLKKQKVIKDFPFDEKIKHYTEKLKEYEQNSK